jgi:HSP20 family protein
MAESVERYFLKLSVGRKSRPGNRLWRPAADVYRTRGGGWVVKVDLAGVSPDDLEVIITDTTLHIHGCRRDTFYGEGISYQQLEITYSRFEKTLHFPCPIEEATLLRDYRDGLLIIHLRSGDRQECEPVDRKLEDRQS